ncbi:ferritin-like domain-containing protein [Hoyosella sp. G463]|uniref:Ferritin-like domain-containing protein n=1 Tax=Lolliginicoccus lacisalsi TaxID=2742202 RepID=A0A927PLK0_9ACTN|nr:ferritin-like domain-containing protein [Lolliginicoccus lacisalsi]MBD8505462.1 ferritin-like domain-containing protein [Lolliginicoccus lacisalsi]
MPPLRPLGPHARDSHGSPGPGNDPASLDEASALARALDREHAAVYVYGMLQAFADASARAGVGAALAVHRARRDAVAELLATRGMAPVIAAPAYEPPADIDSSASALRVAAIIEDDCARAWHAVIVRATARTVREAAIDALSECARTAASWRIALGDQPATEPFPGSP